MTDIKVNENGQAYFDFDALEKLTSKEFVKRVQSAIRGSLKYKIKIIEGANMIRLIIVDEFIMTFLSYFLLDRSIEEVTFAKHQVEEMLTGDWNG